MTASLLDAASKTTGDTAFAINVTDGGTSASCPDGTTAKMSWNAFQANVDPADGTLKNTAAAGAATNVAIALYNVNGSQIDLSNASDVNNPAATLAGGSAQLRYVAKYKAIGGAASAGAVQSALEYIVEFN